MAGSKRNRLTAGFQSGRIIIPAAPRNLFSASLSSAPTGFMKEHLWAVRSVILCVAIALAASAAFAVTTSTTVKHRKKKAAVKTSVTAQARANTMIVRPLVATTAGAGVPKKRAWVQTWD